jgi:hypothetical protein
MYAHVSRRKIVRPSSKKRTVEKVRIKTRREKKVTRDVGR